MTDQPTTNADAQPTPEAELSIQEQLDQLLLKVEKAEPGLLDPSVLPEGAVTEPEPEQVLPAEPEALASDASAAEDVVAQAMTAFEQAIEPAEQPAQEQAIVAEPMEPADEPEPQGDPMLASLEAALEGLQPDANAGFGPAGQAPAPSAPAEASEPAAEARPAPTIEPMPEADPAAAMSESEAQLQDEINALLNASPEPAQADAPAAEVAIETTEQAADDHAPAMSDEDRIAQEIEGLLNADQDPAKQDDATTIDDLDQMLASEIDANDELMGNFQSVQDVTAGIQAAEPPAAATDDAHAATARDVAAELDSQPEDQPASEFDGEDPLAMLSMIAETAEQNEAEYQEQQAAIAESKALTEPVWLARLNRAKERLLRTCFAINWPARRYLSAEHRANLGYIAILNLFGGIAIWFYLIFL